jgi:fused signal recognition particle receptor
MDPLVISLSETAQLVLGAEHLGILALVALVSGGIGFGFGRRGRPGLDLDEGLDELESAQGSEPLAVQQTAPKDTKGSANKSGFFAGFARSRAALADQLARWTGAAADLPALDELEEVLISADVGVRTSMEIVEGLRSRSQRDTTGEQLQAMLRDEVRRRIGEPEGLAQKPSDGPLVLLVVGVNGSGKTTTIGKLAARYQRAGHSVVLAAGDTFRAGAIEQLKVWGGRAGVPVIAQQSGADPAAVIFDALKAAEARGADIVICDTAGRLQAQTALMDELAKVVRVMKKAVPSAPHEVLLVLDGTIGQNALSQAKVFKDVVGVTGVALTKLDGTAKGGVVVAVRSETGLPIKLVGLGEGMDDLRDFDPDAFVDALLGTPEA